MVEKCLDFTVTFRILHRHSGSCGHLNGQCKVTHHICQGVTELNLLKRKTKNLNFKVAINEPLLNCNQVKQSSERDNRNNITKYLTNVSESGPVEIVPDNIETILQTSKSATYQQIRRAKEWLHFPTNKLNKVDTKCSKFKSRSKFMPRCCTFTCTSTCTQICTPSIFKWIFCASR